ncbi:DUF983 domain-containing protein [Polycladidibacter hongkongensis]|uniref:DUF983 domain-containing protein n=1 Tax=Polycladidibacter hongkongensis TaxID=1647556 RepID=UPI00082A3B7F|nr:DUF983 domain-containing protein [Pseudovibrio hongkongensis]
MTAQQATLEDTPVSKPERNVADAMLKGSLCRCPSCGQGKVFDGYLKLQNECTACGEELSHARADDAPPYFTIFIVGHVVVALAMWVEIAYRPAMWLHMAMWIPLTIAMSLGLLRPLKGAIVGLQWALRMHGFEGAELDKRDREQLSKGTGSAADNT